MPLLIKLAISRKLYQILDEENKIKLKQNNLLTVDSRKKERRSLSNSFKILSKITFPFVKVIQL